MGQPSYVNDGLCPRQRAIVARPAAVAGRTPPVIRRGQGTVRARRRTQGIVRSASRNVGGPAYAQTVWTGEWGCPHAGGGMTVREDSVEYRKSRRSSLL